VQACRAAGGPREAESTNRCRGRATRRWRLDERRGRRDGEQDDGDGAGEPTAAGRLERGRQLAAGSRLGSVPCAAAGRPNRRRQGRLPGVSGSAGQRGAGAAGDGRAAGGGRGFRTLFV
jgi:hypothetical protein